MGVPRPPDFLPEASGVDTNVSYFPPWIRTERELGSVKPRGLQLLSLSIPHGLKPDDASLDASPPPPCFATASFLYRSFFKQMAVVPSRRYHLQPSRLIVGRFISFRARLQRVQRSR